MKLTDLYDPQSAGINVQSPQSESTPRRLTLAWPHCDVFNYFMILTLVAYLISIFTGFAAKELATRIKHLEPKAILTANVGIEPSRVIQ